VRRLLSVLGVVLVLTVAWVAPAMAAPPSPASPAGPPERALGIVHVRGQAHAARPRQTNNLSYHGGPVMLTGNVTYTIFWAGSNANWGDSPNAPQYIPTIRGYFANVAAASGSHSNVYSTDTQYYDTSNTHIAYSSSVGLSTTDTTPYPANGCTDKATTICLSDAQLQTELINVMTAKGWTASSGGVQNMFFIFTPKGVGSCVGSSCAYTSYCAYHSWINSAGGAILYANQPYAAQNYSIYTCDSGQHPNGTTADATLNVVSHEHNETITDEQGSAWFDSQGAENGDKCAWNFGTALGSTTYGQYNQAIGTGKYYLQQEWSNATKGCRLTY